MFTKMLLVTVLILSNFTSLTVQANHTLTVFKPLGVRHEYAVYGLRSGARSGGCTGTQYTDIFSYDTVEKSTKKLFSDRKLPIVILHTSGGGKFSLHYVVGTSLKNRKLYARMIQRNQYKTECDPAGSFYEISTDGTNTYRKLFDFEKPESFYISPDGTKIASNYGHMISIRNINSGKIIQQINLEEYQSSFLSEAISWASDSKAILINLGNWSDTINDPNSKAGSYLINIQSKEMKKLVGALFQTPQDLTNGYQTDPNLYVYAPNSNQLVGEARKYVTGESTYYVKLYKVDLDGSNLKELVLGGMGGEYAWMHFVSPGGYRAAYQCGDGAICTTNFSDNSSKVISPKPLYNDKFEQHQTILGWFIQ
jgi:hypothetical protein